MSSFSWESLRAELHAIFPAAIPVISTVSANSNVAYLIDTVLWQDAAEANFNSQDLNGNWIYQPDDATAGDRERRIGGNTGNAIDLDNGRIYPVVAWAGAPTAGDQYEITWDKPGSMFARLVSLLGRKRVAAYGPVIAGADEDMEDSGTSAFAVDSGGTLSKVATAANVDTGKQSLRWQSGGAGEVLTLGTYRVTPGQQYSVSVCFRCDAGGPGIFVIQDNENSAEIQSGDRVSHAFEDFMVAVRTFTAPSGCETVTLELVNTGAADDIYIDRFFPPRESVIKAPSWLTREVDLNQLLLADYRRSATGVAGTVYSARSRVFDAQGTLRRGADFNYRVSHASANPYEIELTDEGYRRAEGKELWVESTRPASDFYTLANTAAGETSPTVNLDKRLIAIEWGMAEAKAMLQRDGDDSQALEFLRDIEAEHNALTADYIPDLEGAQPRAQRPANLRWSV